ncbi:hypothetical protein J2847_004078 [Azospirillum agricola]|uniref:hypothetical protein n=1 Tax=Azospirillum agricola TaxID=1720247 RepID=UPI001AE90BF0|nr:hypothetical protein [Azospirillum agricola]MBP2230769.1 hypothetical protein [Azospirillum agricola]
MTEKPPVPATLIERLRGVVRIPVNDGAGLLDGKDFFERHFPASKLALEAAARIEELEAASPAPPAPSADPLAPIRQAIADYHYALDGDHGVDIGVKSGRALHAIEAALDMRWQPGAEKARRDAAQAEGAK